MTSDTPVSRVKVMSDSSLSPNLHPSRHFLALESTSRYIINSSHLKLSHTVKERYHRNVSNLELWFP